MHFSTTLLLATLPLLIAGQTYKASITEYGTGDERGSRNCNTKTTACGFFTKPGYSAAASENIFGVGDGQGAGPGCKTCWRLTGQTDSTGRKLRNPKSIVVKVRNITKLNAARPYPSPSSRPPPSLPTPSSRRTSLRLSRRKGG